MLTRKQHELLVFIQRRLNENGVSPSFDEMKEALGLKSKSGIHRLISGLEERGFIRRLPHRARALEILKLPDSLQERLDGFTPRVIEGDRTGPPADAMPVAASATELPVMGRIAAGTPIEAISEVATHVAVPQQMLGSGKAHYALEVKGDSMVDAGINEGDIVVIEEGPTADNGDIVVALVEGYEATLKRFRRKGGMVALEAANPAYQTRMLREDQVEVQGRLVGLIRTY